MIRRLLAAVVAVLACVGLLAGCGKKAGLTSSSSCKDFLNASPTDQVSAIDKIAAQEHAPNSTTPLGQPNIGYLCAGDPNMTLGEAIRRTG